MSEEIDSQIPNGLRLGKAIDEIIAVFGQKRKFVNKIEMVAPDLVRLHYFAQDENGKIHASRTGEVVMGLAEMRVDWIPE